MINKINLNDQISRLNRIKAINSITYTIILNNNHNNNYKSNLIKKKLTTSSIQPIEGESIRLKKEIILE